VRQHGIDRNLARKPVALPPLPLFDTNTTQDDTPPP
jgi:hypothetical protein